MLVEGLVGQCKSVFICNGLNCGGGGGAGGLLRSHLGCTGLGEKLGISGGEGVGWGSLIHFSFELFLLGGGGGGAGVL